MDEASEKKAFILTIDDDEINNMLLAAILEDEPIECKHYRQEHQKLK